MTKIPDTISPFPDRYTLDSENWWLGGEMNSICLFVENKCQLYLIIQALSFYVVVNTNSE